MIAPPHSACGDGIRSQDEACDDGNAVAGDGCAADCRTVDPGVRVRPGGKPCHRIARCGDGVAVMPELCDDGNVDGGRRLLGHLQARARVEVQRQPEQVQRTPPAATRRSKAPRAATTAMPCRSTAARPTARTSPSARPAAARACPAAGTASSSTRRATTATTSSGDGCSATARSSRGSCASSRRWATQMVVPARVPRLPRQDAGGFRAGRERAHDGAHRDGQADAGRGRRARLQQTLAQQPASPARRRSRSGTATRRA